jgi:hypothetical protein
VSLWGITWTPTNTFDTGVENPKGKKGENGKRENYKMSGDYKMFKTYVDYGLDKDPKEEFKNDPLTPVLEWLGSLGKGEYGWYQILVTDEGNYNNSKYPAHYVLEHEHKHVQLKEIAKLRIAQLRGEKKSEIKFKKGDVILDEYGRAKTTRDAEGKEVPLTTLVDIYEKSESKKEGDMRPEEKDEIESIYRKISKPIVLCVFRTAYLNTKKQGDFVGNIQSTLSNVKQYGQAGFNGFKPRPTDPYEYKWEDVDKHRKPWRAEEFYESYVEREGYMPHIMPRPAVDKFWDLRFWNRSMGFRKITRIMYDTFFHPFDHPHATDVFALNLEELATFWHLPGQVATTPGIARIDSIKSEAPINLPM